MLLVAVMIQRMIDRDIIKNNEIVERQKIKLMIKKFEEHSILSKKIK